MDRDLFERDLAVELAHFHVNKALRSADTGDWDACTDQLYRASTIGGEPYCRLYRWLARQLEVPTERVQFCWMVPRDGYYLPATTG
jgi:hypothetical protein